MDKKPTKKRVLRKIFLGFFLLLSFPIISYLISLTFNVNLCGDWWNGRPPSLELSHTAVWWCSNKLLVGALWLYITIPLGVGLIVRGMIEERKRYILNKHA